MSENEEKERRTPINTVPCNIPVEETETHATRALEVMK